MTDTTVTGGPPPGPEDVAWNLGDLYAGSDDPRIDADIQQTDATADDRAATYRGRLASLDAEELYEALQAYEGIIEGVYKLGAFAGRQGPPIPATRATGPCFSASTNGDRPWSKSWSSSSGVTNAPDATAKRLIEDPTLAHFRHWLEVQRLYKPHRLSEPEEKILSEKAVTGRDAWTRFFGQMMGSMRYPLDGEQVTQSQILARLYDPDRALRIQAQEAVTGVLQTNLPTLSYIFNTLAGDKASDDRLRNFPTWVSARNMANEVSDAMVEALVEAVTARYDIVARYYRLKRDLLGLDQLYDYDRYAPLPSATGQYAWEDARAICSRPTGPSTRARPKSPGSSSRNPGLTRRPGPASPGARTAPGRSPRRIPTSC